MGKGAKAFAEGETIELRLAEIDAAIKTTRRTGPTTAPPGSPEKVGVLALRLKKDLPLFDRRDAQLKINLTTGKESNE